MSASPSILLSVEDLSLAVAATGATVVDGASLQLAPGEILGIVGESGSGKTLLARTVMRLQPASITPVSGRIMFKGVDLLRASAAKLRARRGCEIGMVFQEPMTSLNPSMRIGRQMEEGLVLHTKLSAAERRARILEILRRVGIQEPEHAMEAYPHEFSGGMRQRMMLASVMLLRPALLIADEPTTALDTVVQKEVMDLMVELAAEHGAAVLLISHDLPMVARYTQRVVVMEKGRVVEAGPTADILARPRHPYTARLLAALPQRGAARAIGEQDPILQIRDLVVDYASAGGLWGRRKAPVKRALQGVTMEVRQGEMVAVVGGSGSGKTTLSRVVSGMIMPTSGSVMFNGRTVDRKSAGYADYRDNCQMIFQDPYSSLDPRLTVGALVAEGLGWACKSSASEKKQRVEEIMADVELSAAFIDRYPHELSGGQRQRVAISRALIRRPSFVIADEPVSALDMTVRAKILDLFITLQQKYRFACIFVSHDLAAVEQIADRVVVLHRGQVVEAGSRDQVFDHPRHAYTRTLLSAGPRLEPNDQGGVRILARIEGGPVPGIESAAVCMPTAYTNS